MAGECSEVVGIARQHPPVRFGHGDHDRIDNGTPPRPRPQPGGSPRGGLVEVAVDVASRQQAVRVRVSTGAAGDQLDDADSRNRTRQSMSSGMTSTR